MSIEELCREWLNGCSCAPKGEPWQCDECTAAFHEALQRELGQTSAAGLTAASHRPH